jgi:hypothetical protein
MMVDASSVLVLIATISQSLPVFSNFVPVSHKRNVEEHVLSIAASGEPLSTE